MRKVYLLILILGASYRGSAQYQLSGTAYLQAFDSLQWGLPDGWSVYAEAKDTALGVAAPLNGMPSTATRWNNAGGGFKNVASANGFSSYQAASPALQLIATDRALGVRQTGSFGDPGAAFTFLVDHTFGLSDLELSFKRQSLDSNSGRSTEWLVQYAIGDSPLVFTTQAAFRTDGFTFENAPLTVSFGSVLDGLAENVRIRIVTLASSTGSGSRTTTAIDDVALRWKGLAIPGFRPLVQRLFPLNGAMDVDPGSNLSVLFSRHISLGATGDIRVSNETDHTVQVIPAGSAALSVSGRKLLISGVVLEYGKKYHVTFDSSIVDTAGLGNYALEDTGKWRFSTAPPLAVPYTPSAGPEVQAIDKGNGKLALRLAGMAPGNCVIRLFDGYGQHVCTENRTVYTSGQEFTFYDLALAPGVYIVRVSAGRSERVQKFIMR